MSENAQTGSRVALDTSKGRIVVELFADKAPKTVANFLQYVQSGHYDGTIFHRVIPSFMIQGGGFSADMKPEGHPGTDPERGGQRRRTTAGAPWPWRAPAIRTAPPRSSSST